MVEFGRTIVPLPETRPVHLYNISVDAPPDSTDAIYRALEAVGGDAITVSDEGPSEFSG